jgi:hypothetical protein
MRGSCAASAGGATTTRRRVKKDTRAWLAVFDRAEVWQSSRMHPRDFDPGAFGILPEDEGLHPHDPESPSWNESIFYDFCGEDGDVAGHVRVGRMPGQDRVWVWCFVAHEGDWVAFEDPHVPLDRVREFDVESADLSLTRAVLEPLLVNQVSGRGRGRYVTGPRAGEPASFSFSLRFEAIGPCHTIGDRGIAGHTAGELEASRFEQPMRVTGTCEVGGQARAVDGWGERDHSWGPRDWNIEWTFLALSGPEWQSMAVRVQFDEETFFDTGYLARGEMDTVEEAEFSLALDPERIEGRVRVVDAAGRTLEGAIEPLSQVRIDASHAFSPPQPSDYRRTLVRFTPAEGGAPRHGFLETNRFPDGIPVPDDDAL